MHPSVAAAGFNAVFITQDIQSPWLITHTSEANGIHVSVVTGSFPNAGHVGYTADKALKIVDTGPNAYMENWGGCQVENTSYYLATAYCPIINSPILTVPFFVLGPSNDKLTVDNLTVNGQGVIIEFYVFGNGGNDTIIDNGPLPTSGIPLEMIFRGGPGNDSLQGGLGRDILNGGQEGDLTPGSIGLSAINQTIGTRCDYPQSITFNTCLFLVHPPLEMGFGPFSENDDHTLGSGSDTLIGNGGNDWLIGSDGSDSLEGGAGGDALDGGPGIDNANYSSAPSGVTIDLSTTAQYTGGAGNDSIVTIENLSGSSYNDWLTGDGNANAIIGGVGSDTLRGGGGNDTLLGGQGPSGAGPDVRRSWR